MPRVPDSERTSAGWQTWREPKSGEYGFVYIVPLGKFGYYDDDEDENECVVYLHKPMFGDCYTLKRSSLRKPPFEGEFEAM